MKNRTLIEYLCILWCSLVAIGVVTATAYAAFGQTVTSSASAPVDVSVDPTDLAGILAGLFVLLGVLFRNPFVRAMVPAVVEYVLSKLRRKSRHRKQSRE